MARSNKALSIPKSSLLHLALVPAVLAAVPAVALLVLAIRLLVPLVLVGVAIALVVSPACRRLFVGNTGEQRSW